MLPISIYGTQRLIGPLTVRNKRKRKLNRGLNMPRHGPEEIITNTNDFYEEFFEARGLDRITHYRSPYLPPITVTVARKFSREKYIWKLGDKYYKIAARAYGDPKLWWVIAWFNQNCNKFTLFFLSS